MPGSDDEEDDVHKQFKIILLGDGAVGKTSIAKRFSDDQFNQIYKQTVGVDFFIRRLKVPPNFNLALQLWDIGGQSIGSKMITNYITGAHAVILCYDITNYDSFVNLEDWHRLVLQAFDKKELPYIALVGNKYDLRHSTVVRQEQHNQFAQENQLNSFMMSAKSGDQVKQAFFKVACELVGLKPSKHDIDIQSDILPATIIDHHRHDEAVNEGSVPDYVRPNKIRFDNMCNLM